jgi:hypothetical protein
MVRRAFLGRVLGLGGLAAGLRRFPGADRAIRLASLHSLKVAPRGTEEPCMIPANEPAESQRLIPGSSSDTDLCLPMVVQRRS